MKKKFRGYIFSRPFFGERVPQHIQNFVIKSYCDQKDFLFLLSFTEYRIANSSLMLNSIMKNLKDIDGVAFYSFFQMPKELSERLKIYKKIIREKKELHFVVEKMIFKSEKQIPLFEDINNIKKFSLISKDTINLINYL